MFDCTVPNNTLSRAELSYDEGTVLNVHYGDVLIKYGSVLDVQKDDIPRIPHRCREDFNGALLQDGDVIIADTAEDETTGKACEIGNLQGSAIVSGLHTMVCRPRNRMALGYLGYYLNSNAYHHQLLPLMQGIKVLSLSRSNIQKTSVSYPIAEKEQQLIAYYFSQLDDLITLHQRKCASIFSSFQAFFSMMFTTSTFSWEQRKVGDLIEDYIEKTIVQNQYPVLTSSQQQGIVLQEDYFADRQVTTNDNIGYYVLPRGYFTYRSRSDTDMFVFNRNNIINKGIISYYYPVFLPKNCDSNFLLRRLNHGIRKQLSMAAEGTGQKVLAHNKFKNMVVDVPSTTEQCRIGIIFEMLDHLITLHQRKCASIFSSFQAFFSMMFTTSTFSWEQRKAKELFVSTADKGYPELPVLSATQDRGMIRRDENSINIFHDKKNEAGYQRVLPGQFVIHLRSFQGGFAHSAIEGITSPAYTVFGFSEPEKHDSEYWKYVFTSKSFIRRLETVTYGIRDGRSISYDEFLTLGFVYPSKAEQTAIARYLDKLSDLITLHQRQLFCIQSRKFL